MTTVYRLLDRRLALIENSGYADLLLDGLKGVETEKLRVTPENRLVSQKMVVERSCGHFRPSLGQLALTSPITTSPLTLPQPAHRR